MPAGVGTGLEPRTSVGPLAYDVGLKETHPGTLSLGHLPWGLARLLLGELAQGRIQLLSKVGIHIRVR